MSAEGYRPLLNRVALITGANNPFGIGAAVAQDLASAGAHVALTFQREAAISSRSHRAPGKDFYRAQKSKSADEVLAAIQASGGTGIACEADLAAPDTPRLLFDWVEQGLGPVEILINCAAYCEESGDDIFSVSRDTISRTFIVNVQASTLLIQQFAARHQHRGARYGRIINFSTDGSRSFPGQISYAASKAAIESLTRSIAREVGELGITVNAIAPGPIQTGYLSAEVSAELLPRIPLGRIGTPKDAVNAVRYFLLPETDWITGQVLRVAGGHDI